MEPLSVKALRIVLGDLENKDKREYIKKLTSNKKLAKRRFIVLTRGYDNPYCTFSRDTFHYPLNIKEILQIREIYKKGLTYKFNYKPINFKLAKDKACCTISVPCFLDCYCYYCIRMKSYIKRK